MKQSAIPLLDESTNSSIPLRPVSPKLTKVILLGKLVWWIPFVIGMIALHVCIQLFDWDMWLHAIPVVVYARIVLGLYLIPRRVKAMGYATRENDIVLRTGRMFRSLTAVPYGRVQDIEISEGPIERAHGLSTLELKTAAFAFSDTTIRGLERAESDRIRDLVMREANEKMAAL